jgi:3-oxoacyl-[acyl-carrier protein] reductase
VTADLSNRVVVIGGGAGDVGEGLTCAFLKAGASVYVPSRSPEKLDELRVAMGATGDLTTCRLARFDDRELGRCRDQILDRHGRIDAVVASLGGWWGGKTLVDTDAATWSRLIDAGLLSHATMARVFLPALAAGGTYTLLNGTAALAPVPGSAAVSVLAAAQTMLARALIAEVDGAGVRVNQLLITSVVATRARRHTESEWITAEEVGEVAAWIASPAGAMVAGSIMPLGPRPRRHDREARSTGTAEARTPGLQRGVSA